METCLRCGSDLMATIPGPHPGGHFAKLICASCGRWIKWLSRPASPTGEVPGDILAMVHARRLPAPLRGTEAQRRYARSLRATALHSFARMGRNDLVALVKCVVDSTWFVANKGRRLLEIRWPSPLQMESGPATGTCPACGDPVYSAFVCSDECCDESSAVAGDREARSRSMQASASEPFDEFL